MTPEFLKIAQDIATATKSDCIIGVSPFNKGFYASCSSGNVIVEASSADEAITNLRDKLIRNAEATLARYKTDLKVVTDLLNAIDSSRNPQCSPTNRHSVLCKCDGRGILPKGMFDTENPKCDCVECGSAPPLKDIHSGEE